MKWEAASNLVLPADVLLAVASSSAHLHSALFYNPETERWGYRWSISFASRALRLVIAGYRTGRLGYGASPSWHTPCRFGQNVKEPFCRAGQAKVLIKLINITSYPFAKI